MDDTGMHTIVLRPVDKQVASVNGLASAGRANLPPRSEAEVEGEATLDGQQKGGEGAACAPHLVDEFVEATVRPAPLLGRRHPSLGCRDF